MNKLKSFFGLSKSSKSSTKSKTDPHHEVKADNINNNNKHDNNFNKELNLRIPVLKTDLANPTNSFIKEEYVLSPVYNYGSVEKQVYRSGRLFHTAPLMTREFHHHNPDVFLSDVTEEYEHKISDLDASSAEETERYNRILAKYEGDLAIKEEELMERVRAAQSADLAMEVERMRRLLDERPRQHAFLDAIAHNSINELLSPISPSESLQIENLDMDEHDMYTRIINMEVANNMKNVAKSSHNVERQLYRQLEVDQRKFESALSAQYTKNLQEIERQRKLLDEWLSDRMNEYERLKSGQQADAMEDAEQRARVEAEALERERAKLDSNRERQYSYEKVVKEAEMERQNRILHTTEY